MYIGNNKESCSTLKANKYILWQTFMVQNSQCHIQYTSHAFYYTAQICVWQGLEIKEEKNFKSTPGDTASWSFEKYYYFNGTLLCTLLTKTSIMCSNDIFILTFTSVYDRPTRFPHVLYIIDWITSIHNKWNLSPHGTNSEEVAFLFTSVCMKSAV